MELKFEISSLTTFYELLRLIQPALVGAILISRRGLHGFDAGLHRAGSLAAMAEARVRAAHQVQRFRIRRPVFEKPFERIARVFKLARGDVSGAHFAPDFVLTVRLIAGDNLFEVFDGIANRFCCSAMRPS